MSSIKIVHGTATITLAAAIDEENIVENAGGDEVSRTTTISYALADLETAVQMVRNAVGSEASEGGGGPGGAPLPPSGGGQ